jgi:hypothetical protein
MMFHVMPASYGDAPPKGLCGATVKDFYVSEVPAEADERQRPDLCPVCLALAMKIKSRYDAATMGNVAES